MNWPLGNSTEFVGNQYLSNIHKLAQLITTFAYFVYWCRLDVCYRYIMGTQQYVNEPTLYEPTVSDRCTYNLICPCKKLRCKTHLALTKTT